VVTRDPSAKKPFLVKRLVYRRELNGAFVFGRSLQGAALVSTKGLAIGGNGIELFQTDSGTARASSKVTLSGQEGETSPDGLVTTYYTYPQPIPTWSQGTTVRGGSREPDWAVRLVPAPSLPHARSAAP